MSIVGQHIQYKGLRAEITRQLGTWQGRQGQTIGRESIHFNGLLINLWQSQQPYVIRHVRVIENDGYISVAE